MGMFDKMRDALAEAHAAGQPRSKSERRDLTEDDRLAWYDAGSEREKAIRPQTIADVQALVRNRNPVRWRQLQGHYKWLQKEMKRMGLNPEDARYML